MYHADIVDLARVRNTFSPAIDHAVLENISEVVTDGLENAAPTPQERIEFVDYVLTSYLEWNKSISAIVEEMGKVTRSKQLFLCSTPAKKTAEIPLRFWKCLQRVL